MKMYFNCSILFLTLLHMSLSCDQWCRKPMSFEFFCCDSHSLTTPAATSNIGLDKLAENSTAEGTNESATREAAAKRKLIRIRPMSCRYYCVYGDKVYCCDDGSRPLPPDHDSHNGRCPTKKETVCKKGGIYLHIHVAKMMTKAGGRLLSSRGQNDHHPSCASDGYCSEDEKCCENICAKKHTCLKALYDYDGARLDNLKKKYAKRKRYL
ncbi:UNVERIFIED_CONTAM: hypothetical protein RMT77_000567 [Armadillidium vulgare]